ncbi:hypothetical protein MJT46_001648 [Ovis ammon polii x Ovis aries]|nr:hypothetical protein MJT46_001648 [Ovis ammon polii x Ovis aries]
MRTGGQSCQGWSKTQTRGQSPRATFFLNHAKKVTDVDHAGVAPGVSGKAEGGRPIRDETAMPLEGPYYGLSCLDTGHTPFSYRQLFHKGSERRKTLTQMRVYVMNRKQGDADEYSLDVRGNHTPYLTFKAFQAVHCFANLVTLDLLGNQWTLASSILGLNFVGLQATEAVLAELQIHMGYFLEKVQDPQVLREQRTYLDLSKILQNERSRGEKKIAKPVGKASYFAFSIKEMQRDCGPSETQIRGHLTTGFPFAYRNAFESGMQITDVKRKVFRLQRLKPEVSFTPIASDVLCYKCRNSSIPWEEELRCDWELCPRHRGRACSESLLQSLPLSRLMAAASLPLAGSGYITYLPDADLPAAAGGSLRIIPEPQQRVHFQINMDLNSSGIIPDALGSPGELVSALFPSEQFFVTRQPQNRIGLPQHTFVFKCMCLQGKLESTCDPNCDPVTCDLPGISETTEQLEHLDLQDQYLYPRSRYDYRFDPRMIETPNGKEIKVTEVTKGQKQ